MNFLVAEYIEFFYNNDMTVVLNKISIMLYYRLP